VSGSRQCQQVPAFRPRKHSGRGGAVEVEQTVVHKWQKNSREYVQCGVSEFEGYEMFFAWVYVDGGVIPGKDLKPTKKGLSIRTDQLAELEKAIEKAKQELWKQRQLETTGEAVA